MPIRILKPTSAGRRNASVNTNAEITKNRPEKSLVEPKRRTNGRNNQGKITVRGRGGGHKRLYRKIDFRRSDRVGIEGTVKGIEYDPNRTCHIALIEYSDGVKRYILAPKGLKDGDKVVCSDEAIDPTPGSFMRLRHIPTGFDIHCIELSPGSGGKLCRSAGVTARLTNKEDDYATIVLPSGELRKIPIDCRAAVGTVGNADHTLRRLGKAGKSRHLGIRPKTRGVAMSHHAHPLGGGEGRSKTNRAPVSKSGTEAKGGSTRNKKQFSQELIIRRRKSKRYGQLK